MIWRSFFKVGSRSDSYSNVLFIVDLLLRFMQPKSTVQCQKRKCWNMVHFYSVIFWTWTK